MSFFRKLKDDDREDFGDIDVVEADEEIGEPEEEPEPEEDDSEDEFEEDESDAEDEIYEETGSAVGRSKGLYIGITVAVAVIALIVGYIVGSGTGSTSSSSSTGVSSAYITDDELDAVVATWTYDGTTYELTEQEAIESQYSLEAVMEDDGTYPVATADVILSYVRNQVLIQEAESLGLSVTEEEAAAYAEDTLGSSDYEYISETYGVTEEQAEEIVTQMALIQALYDSVMPEVDATLPDAPEEPEDDDEDTPTEEYAAYIIELLGDEWDTENDTWATTDGDYYSMLGDEDFSSEGATYSQAVTAYYVAYLLYSSAYSEASATWTEYANELYGSADITIYGLYS